MRKEKPTFFTYQELFLQIVQENLQRQPALTENWLQIAPQTVREQILQQFKHKLEQEYQVEQVLEPQWLNLEASLETLTIRLHHVFSNVYLMQQINDKILARRN